MAENRALSQGEIDALLNQIPEGGDAGSADGAPAPATPLDSGFSRIIKAYDFRRPDKFSKEQWGTLQSMYEAFSRFAGAAFSSRLRTLVNIRLSSIDQGLYEEWQAQVPSQTACYVLSMQPLTGNIVVEFNLDVAAEVVDRMLGGNGLLIDRTREMSDVEVGMLRSFSSVVAQSLQEMWSAVVPVRSQLQDFGLDAGLIQVASPTDVVLTAFFEVSVGSRLGAMSICVPYTVLEPITSQLSAQVWFSSGRPQASTDEERDLMQALIARSELELQVELGSVELPTSSMLDLQEGDTIVLDHRVGRPLDVIVDGRPRFRGMPGLSGKYLGLRVTETVEQEYGLDAPAATGLRLPPEELGSLTQQLAPPPVENVAGAGSADAPDAPIPLFPNTDTTDTTGGDASSDDANEAA
jgi:flagellar motor switch protein FliM